MIYSTLPEDEANKRLPELLITTPHRVGVNSETYSLDDTRLLGLAIAFTPSIAYYITSDDPRLNFFIDLLKRKDIRKVYHNAPFDLRVLRDYGVDTEEVDDTAIMARLSMEYSADLYYLTHELGEGQGDLGRFQTSIDSDLIAKYRPNQHKKADMSCIPTEILADSCMRKAKAPLLLYAKYSGQQSWYTPEFSMSYYEKQRKLIHILACISSQGIKLDKQRNRLLYNYYLNEVNRLRLLGLSYGVNLSSPAQVGEWLITRNNFLPPTKKLTQIITGDKYLAKLHDPAVQLVLAYRHHAKELSTYIEPYLDEDRAYTLLKMEAATGRLNSTNFGKSNKERNLQNITKNEDSKYAPYSIRSQFIPDNSLFTKVDKSQLELRVLAHLSKDEKMLAAFNSGADFHKEVVDLFHISRVEAKTFNFSMAFNGSVQTTADNIKSTNLELVTQRIHAWKALYTGVTKWWEGITYDGLRNGYVVTAGGRKIRLPTELGEKHVLNCIYNYPVQGTAFEDVAELMLHPEIAKYLDVTRLQVHDELIFDGDINLPEVHKDKKGVLVIDGELAHLSNMYLPLEVSKVDRWG